ncbi:MAG: hypothetical protein M1828_001948 [Chrysothrix sp. TS-e1954]|nr:MAG: hypothetical protein M1828_001948 [Chrysothrix sp. TS-e1954]
MEGQADIAWPQEPSEMALLPEMNDDDFSSFFDFGNADLSLTEFEANSSCNPDLNSQPGTTTVHGDMSSLVSDGPGQFFDMPAQMSPHRHTQSAGDLYALKQSPAFHKMPRVMNPYMSPAQVPPTPESTRIYPSVQDVERMRHAAQGSVNGHYTTPMNLNAFTPAMTPPFSGVDAAGNYIPHVPPYSMPNGYNISPTVSPAILPQQSTSNASRLSRTADSSLTASPIEFTSGLHGEATQDGPRKSRKKAPSSPVATRASRTKKSTPSTASKRRANATVQNISGQSTKQSQSSSSDASRSISPRDALTMAPPPKPITPAATPVATPRARPLHPTQDQQGKAGLPPATPASIMRQQKESELALQTASASISQDETLSPATQALDAQMEFLKLPEAAASVPPASQSTGQKKPLRPSNSASNSAVQSPTGPVGKDESEVRPGRPPKKRGSNSNLVSPALRPKISPGLKPLYPEGSHFSPQDHALLLATRSNYQNLLDGTNPPGVTYSTDLSSGLSSKRTSHKLAEQGRRDRINAALQEMQSLLPPAFATSTLKENGADSPGANGNEIENTANGTTSTPLVVPQNGNSKAATVECAINYIKHLQGDRAERDAEHESLMREVEALRATKAS